MPTRVLPLAVASISFLATPGAGRAADEPCPSAPDPSAVRYQVPAGQPEGSVSLLSFGIEPLKSARGVARDYLHVRIIAENHSGPSPWQVDPAEQRLREGFLRLQPRYAETSTDKAALKVTTGQKGWLDLFFAVDRKTAPASLVVDWAVDIGGRVEQETTAFDRESGAALLYYGPEISRDSQFIPVGPNWWYASEPWVNCFMDQDLSLTHLYRITHRRHIYLPPMAIHSSMRDSAPGGSI
jgi:hypothetical protein